MMFDKIFALAADVFNVIRGKGSFKTGYAGLIAAVVVILNYLVSPLVDGNPETGIKWAELVGGVSLALGVYVARDDDKTSEQVGNK